MTTITRKRANIGATLVALLSGAVCHAAQLQMPDGSRQTVTRTRDPGSYALPLGAWTPEGIPTQMEEGRITLSAWRLPVQGLTSLQVLAPLRDQLIEQGYEVLFECAAQACGGFDFRFETEVLAAPSMYVDLSDYRFLSARGLRNDHISLLVSRNSGAAYVQVISSDYTQAEPLTTFQVETPSVPTVSGGVAQQLVAFGHVILSDLAFSSGTSNLGAGEYTSLADLAKFLQDNPNRRVVLVGHTDAVGSLEGNRALSRRRAGSVRARLVEKYGIPGGQIDAQGAGYLAPVASNGTDEGREANRRVEAVLLPD